ncbi:MAG: hypothetical protein IT430_18135 [Phycisphaerales bacterium]|nr:hypothetical protein [Phycisphaerales bacterium]
MRDRELGAMYLGMVRILEPFLVANQFRFLGEAKSLHRRRSKWTDGVLRIRLTVERQHPPPELAFGPQVRPRFFFSPDFALELLDGAASGERLTPADACRVVFHRLGEIRRLVDADHVATTRQRYDANGASAVNEFLRLLGRAEDTGGPGSR